MLCCLTFTPKQYDSMNEMKQGERNYVYLCCPGSVIVSFACPSLENRLICLLTLFFDCCCLLEISSLPCCPFDPVWVVLGAFFSMECPKRFNKTSTNRRCSGFDKSSIDCNLQVVFDIPTKVIHRHKVPAGHGPIC